MNSSLQDSKSKLNIPLSVIKYVSEAGIRKAFASYLHLKFLFSGKVHSRDLFQSSTLRVMGIKDSRTFNKYISQLLDHQFLVYNQKSGYYFIRGFERLRIIHGLKDKTSVIFYYNFITSIQSFIDTALIGQLIRNQEYYWVKGRRKFRRAAYTMKDNANTLVKVDQSTKPPYFGLSNSTIAKNLNCSLSQACKKKHKAEALGMLKTKGHFKLYTTLPKADYRVRSQIYTSHPKLINRLRFSTNKNPDTGLGEIQLLQQLHDEITPLITFSKRKGIGLLLTM